MATGNESEVLAPVGTGLHLLSIIVAAKDAQLNNEALEEKYGGGKLSYNFTVNGISVSYRF